ncbi:MAG: hypothetical protein ACE37H_08060 [Phycisphaeraceae bacterium]
MMMSFDGLLRSIHPAVTLDRFEREANNASLEVRAPHPLPRSARDLLLHLVALQHRMSRSAGDRTPFPTVHFESNARAVDELLRRQFQGRGIGVAMQLIQAKGASGLREVREILVQSHIREFTRLVVKRRVDAFWAEQDTQGKVVSAKYYLAKFSHLLTADQRRRDPIRLATVLPNILYGHPFRLRQLTANERFRR